MKLSQIITDPAIAIGLAVLLLAIILMLLVPSNYAGTIDTIVMGSLGFVVGRLFRLLD